MKLLLLASLGLSMSLYAQIENIAHGAENESLGDMMSIAKNEASTQGNPAGLSHTDTVPCVSVSSLNYPALPSLGKLNLCVYKPFLKYHMGLSINRLGTDHFNKHSIYLAFAHRINSISLGLSLSYHQWYAEGYTTKRALQGNLGGNIRLGKSLHLGTYITNITQSRWTEAQNDVLPTLMALGLRYALLKNVILLLELEKYTQLKANLKMGLSYQMNSLFLLHMGVHGATKRIFTGLGVNSRKISIWCSYSYNYYLLSGIQLTLKYSFK